MGREGETEQGAGLSRLNPLRLFSLSHVGRDVGTVEELTTAIESVLRSTPPARLLPTRVDMMGGPGKRVSVEAFDRFVSMYECVVRQREVRRTTLADGVRQEAERGTRQDAGSEEWQREVRRTTSAEGVWQEAEGGTRQDAGTSGIWQEARSEVRQEARNEIRLEAALPQREVRRTREGPGKGTEETPWYGYMRRLAQQRKEGEKEHRCGECIYETRYEREIERKEEKNELETQMQRELVGWARGMIYLAQDFMATFCKEDQRGWFTEKAGKLVIRMNEAILPWASILGKITTHKRFRQIEEMRTIGKGTPEGPVVYARINMQTINMYIGETEQWERRVKDHHKGTCKHHRKAKQRCQGCEDHVRYMRHQGVNPTEWIMIPIIKANEKYEAKRIERQLIRTMKPSINTADKPIWLLKDTYTKECKGIHRARKQEKPWRTEPGTQTRVPTRLTVYKHDEKTWSDLEGLLRTIGERDEMQKIEIEPGTYDITRWERVRESFGNSIIRVHNEAYTGTLQEWRHKRNEGKINLMIQIYETKRAPPDLLKAAVTLQEAVETATEDELKELWRTRQNKRIMPGIKREKLIKQECTHRYKNFTGEEMIIKIPMMKYLDANATRKMILGVIDEQEWPEYLKIWQKKTMRLITESPKSIGDVLCNVTKPWAPHGECACKKIQDQRIRKLPETEGHILFTSSEYHGGNAKVLRVGANNVPQQTMWDTARAWENIRTQITEGIRPEKDTWKRKMEACKSYTKKNNFVTTKETYKMKQEMDGLICGPLDKNLNELWFACPTLYRKAWDKMYNEQTGYGKIYPKRYAKDAKEIWSNEEITNEKQRGDEQDILKAWRQEYKAKKWDRFATFGKKGGFNRPYILFKAKNMGDPETRGKKWHKARPIAPATKHPMKGLFHKAGRAWSFITNHLEGEHFVMQHTGKVRPFLEETQELLRGKGTLKCEIADIEGCFPNMPKDAIRTGMREQLQMITEKHGYTTITVPNKKSKACSFRKKPYRGYTVIPFEDLLDIMNFTLDNTIVKHFDGTLWRQKQGIPMGDPHSPGMTIGTCAWMENKWMKTIPKEMKTTFRTKRYMDDVLMVYAENEKWDIEKIKRSLWQECYSPPLKLEPGTQGTFLETRFEITNDGEIKQWLKNDNEDGKNKIWRYMHFESYMPFGQKRSIMMACLAKVQERSNDWKKMEKSILDKLYEFLKLDYPKGMLVKACTEMGKKTRDATWFEAREQIILWF